MVEISTTFVGSTTSTTFIIEFDSTKMDALHERDAELKRNNVNVAGERRNSDDDVSSITSASSSQRSCFHETPLSNSLSSSNVALGAPLSTQPLVCPVLPMPRTQDLHPAAAKRTRASDCPPKPRKDAKSAAVSAGPKSRFSVAAVPMINGQCHKAHQLRKRARVLNEMKESCARAHSSSSKARHSKSFPAACPRLPNDLVFPPSCPSQLVLPCDGHQSRPFSAVSREDMEECVLKQAISRFPPLMHFVHHPASAPPKHEHLASPAQLPQSSSLYSITMIPQVVETELPEREALLHAVSALLQQKRCLM
jgi:hypothetical protein